MSRHTDAKIKAGAFELLGITGVSLARGADVLGVRMAYPHPSLGLFDDKAAILSLDAPRAHAPDLSYVTYSWRLPVTPAGLRKVAGWPWQAVNVPPIFGLEPDEAVRVTLEWRCDQETVTGRYTADGPVRVGLFVNACYGGGQVLDASGEHCRVAAGDSVLHVRLAGPTCEPLCIDTRLQAEQAWAGLIPAEGRTMALIPVDLSPQTPLHVAMTLAETDPPLDPATIDAQLEAAADAYETDRMRSTGICQGGAEALAGLSGYSRCYDPRRKRLQTTVNRTWGATNTPGLIFGWDNFFDSYLSAWEDPALGAASLEHIVGVYGENGIPDGPVQRNLIIPVVYCRTLDVIGDAGLARRTWPTMMAFMRFWFEDRGDGHPWRDGNDDGLIELGSNEDAARFSPGHILQAAMDETGYDESPVVSAGFTDGRLGLLADGVDFDWDRRTLTITTVGQNSLYCASCLAMARRADTLGESEDAAWLRAEHQRVAGRMRELLYCEADGFYRNRYWSGDFSPVKAMTVFFPLLAGIADERTATALKEMLLDPNQFWGDNLCPTVSRDDPAYCDGLDGIGNYWRGNCWPPTTYMVYMAIKEAGWDDVAAAYAQRTCRMFLEYWDKHGHAYENFPAEGPADKPFLYVVPWGGRELRYVWSGMTLFCGLEEVFAPETFGPGLRFGNAHLAQETEWTRLRYAGRQVDAAAGHGRTSVRFGDEWQFEAKPGATVRGFLQTDEGFSFSAACEQAVAIDLRAASLAGGAIVRVDGEAIEATTQDGDLRFALPSGQHQVTVGHS